MNRHATPSTLAEQLATLGKDEFLDRIARVPDGGERLFFENDPLISRIVSAMDSSDAMATIELELNSLFETYEPGQVFGHTERVMAILYAMKTARLQGNDEVITAFAKAEGAEFGALSRFARALQRS